MHRMTILLAAALALGTGCVSDFFYYPDRDVYRTPEQLGPRVESVMFPSLDGTQLHGWFLPAAGKAKGTVIHFHGNAQNLTAHVAFVAWLPAAGYHVFAFDYRGYGKSAGEPSRKGLWQDGIAALRYVASRPDVDPDRLAVLGQSLGGAVALPAIVDANVPGIRAIVLDSTFYSYRRIVRDKMKELPVVRWFRWPLSWLVISDAYSPHRAIAERPRVPLLIFHGSADRVIPPEHGRLLYEAAPEPKRLVVIEGGYHTDALMRDRGEHRREVVRLLDEAMAADRGQSSTVGP